MAKSKQTDAQLKTAMIEIWTKMDRLVAKLPPSRNLDELTDNELDDYRDVLERDREKYDDTYQLFGERYENVKEKKELFDGDDRNWENIDGAHDKFESIAGEIGLTIKRIETKKKQRREAIELEKEQRRVAIELEKEQRRVAIELEEKREEKERRRKREDDEDARRREEHELRLGAIRNQQKNDEDLKSREADARVRVYKESLEKPIEGGQKQLRLKDVSVPKFDGDYKKWQEFWDVFESLVHSKNAPAIDKFNILRESVIGEAAHYVKNYKFEAANYEPAIANLKKMYDQPEYIELSIREELSKVSPAQYYSQIVPTYQKTFYITTMPVIDLNSTSSADKTNIIDRFLHSTIIFDCKDCDSDDGIYLLIISEFLGKSRLVKISSTVPLCEWNGWPNIWTCVQNGLVMCIFELPHADEDDEEGTMKFVLYNLKDESKREFDLPPSSDTLELDNSCFWCLHDDGREFGRAIKKEATYIRIVYYCIPTDQAGVVGFAIRQCLLEIPCGVDGQIKVKRLQEITYGSNWIFINRYHRLIRTRRDEVGILGELIDLDATTGEHGDGARWTTCVVYSPETRRLSATGDYERYLGIDPVLRRYFDRNMNSRESMRSLNFRSMRRIKGTFLCPQVLTDSRAIDVLYDASIRSIDFGPRSLKWQSLRSLFDVYGKEYLEKCGKVGWLKLTGVKLDDNILERYS